MKKITVCLILVCLVFSLAAPVWAIGSPVVDFADLITEDEEAYLEEKAETIVDQYGMDVVILTVASTYGESIREFADDFYDENSYGVGSDYSGVLFMLAMDTREWYISTCGDGIYAVTDYGVQELFSSVAGLLSNNDYFSAFDRYLDELDRYYKAFSQEDPMDGYGGDYEGPGSYEPDYDGDIIYYEKPPRSTGSILFISILIGVIVGGIALLIMRSGMKTAKRQSGAAHYLQSDVRITKAHHHYLYSRTTRTVKTEYNGGGTGRGGGGSHVHRSSGGRSHGGGGGRF